jgi:putative restriction endonuclease
LNKHLEDPAVRTAAFEWLGRQVQIHGNVLPRGKLVDGFQFSGQRVPLLSVQGIFKPRVLEKIPLSITTTTKGPYDDSFGPDGLLLYKYRGTDPSHSDNAGLREAMRRQVPLVYFHGVVPGRYLAVWPVFIVGDNPQSLTFAVAADDIAAPVAEELRGGEGLIAESRTEARRAYITTSVRRRLHQEKFREIVLSAYHEQCALCRLRHRELLEAAHIIPDSEERGLPSVTNGLALCKLHHAAFDGYFLGIRPDYTIHVRQDILDENDGPMLTHGLKGMKDKKIVVPGSMKKRPDRELLEVRYQRFLSNI